MVGSIIVITTEKRYLRFIIREDVVSIERGGEIDGKSYIRDHWFRSTSCKQKYSESQKFNSNDAYLIEGERYTLLSLGGEIAVDGNSM